MIKKDSRYQHQASKFRYTQVCSHAWTDRQKDTSPYTHSCLRLMHMKINKQNNRASYQMSTYYQSLLCTCAHTEVCTYRYTSRHSYIHTQKSEKECLYGKLPKLRAQVIERPWAQPVLVMRGPGRAGTTTKSNYVVWRWERQRNRAVKVLQREAELEMCQQGRNRLM